MIKVFLGGEGSNELGTRWHRPMGDQPGVVEALLRRVRADGWCVGGARLWKTIRKYQAGVARGAPNHGDARNVLGLVLHAYEAACELLVFVRDDDGDPDRDPAIAATLDAVATYGFADAYMLRAGRGGRAGQAQARGLGPVLAGRSAH